MYQSPYARRRRGSRIRLLTALALVSVVLYFGWTNFNQTATFTALTAKFFGPIEPKSLPFSERALGAVIASSIKEFSDRSWLLGIVVIDLKTGLKYQFNPDQLFEAASLTKIPVLISSFQMIQRGQLSLDQKISIAASDIQDYGTSVLQYNGPGTQYSLKDLLWYMANRSDNTSFYVLSKLIGEKTINQNIKSWGYSKTDVSADRTTPSEMAEMFEEIYESKFVSAEFSSQMLSLMIDTNDESRIPADLPDEVKVFHKTGNATGGIQDVGAVTPPDRPYILAILTGDVDDENKATGIIAHLSRQVFDYMSSLE